MPTQELYESQDFGGAEGVVYQDTNGIAIKIPSLGLDEDGFINSDATIRFYQWVPGDTSTPLTSEQILANAGTRVPTWAGVDSGRGSSIIPMGPPASDAIEELLGPGGVGIFKENIQATSQYSNMTSYALSWQSANRLILYADVDTASEALRVSEAPDEWGSGQTQMQMNLVYSSEELAALDQKYGGLSSGEDSHTVIDSVLSSMAVTLLQTFTSDRLTQNKAFNKTRLRYKDIVSLTNIEPTSGVNISATASEEIVEATEFSDGFTYTSTTTTGY